MKDKLFYSLGLTIVVILMGLFFYGVYYVLWMIFKRVTPEQAFIAEKLFSDNIFVIVFLLLLAYPIEIMLKSHKARHQRHLNKLAEIEWIEQYGADGTK